MASLAGRGAALLLAVAAAVPAQAQLFPDNEARKAILELRTRLAESEERAARQATEQAAAQAAAQAQAAEQLQALRRSLLDLQNQIELLRTDVARLRGSEEALAREVAELQRRQKDIAQGVDERIRRIEPQKVSVDGREFMAEPDETRLHDDSLALLRGGDFAGAATGLGTLMRRWPGSGYTDSARFWLGNALYGKRNYKEAINSFRAMVAASPAHPRAPEALLAIANCQAEMKDIKAARATLAELQKAYPASEAAAAGKERLASLK